MNERDAEADLALCEAATPLPWYRFDHAHGNGDIYRIDIRGNPIKNLAGKTVASTPVAKMHAGFIWFEGDAKFLIEARTALPYWINESLRLRRRNERLEKALKAMIEHNVDTPGEVVRQARLAIADEGDS